MIDRSEPDTRRQLLQYRLRPAVVKLLCVVMVLIALASLVPVALKFFNQKEEIRATEQGLQQAQQQVAAKQRAVDNWNDPNFIKAQARDRLFYVLPGESQLGIIKDIEIPAPPPQKAEKDLTVSKRQWSLNLLASVINAAENPPPAPPQ